MTSRATPSSSKTGCPVAKPENSFIAGVHGYLPQSLYRMKNHNEYTGGVFDCWYSGMARDLWVEYKFVVLPKRDTTLVVPDLSALQAEWGTERRREGRNVWVVVGCKEGAVTMPFEKWTCGLSSAEFKRLLSSRRDYAAHLTRFVSSP